MMSNILKLSSFVICILLAGCQKQIKPAIVPPPAAKVVTEVGLPVIGGVEPVYFMPMRTPFAARIDTGAEISSIDVEELTPFERDGEKWVSFVMRHAQNGERKVFEKRVVRRVLIRRINKNERRYVVMMDIKIGNELVNTEFTLADREKFEFQALIGRNVLNSRFVVDPAIDNTLH
ncbi:MAG: hypothetical protein E7018_01060 [Alphaproteobacteria bacterium]|nr:hypothetical protein [Alphaproteobacteria bacterium]